MMQPCISGQEPVLGGWQLGQNPNFEGNLVAQLVFEEGPRTSGAAGFGIARNQPVEFPVVCVLSSWGQEKRFKIFPQSGKSYRFGQRKAQGKFPRRAFWPKLFFAGRLGLRTLEK